MGIWTNPSLITESVHFLWFPLYSELVILFQIEDIVGLLALDLGLFLRSLLFCLRQQLIERKTLFPREKIWLPSRLFSGTTADLEIWSEWECIMFRRSPINGRIYVQTHGQAYGYTKLVSNRDTSDRPTDRPPNGPGDRRTDRAMVRPTDGPTDTPCLPPIEMRRADQQMFILLPCH